MFLELSLKTLSLTPKGPTPGEPPTPTWNLFWWTLPSSNKQRSASPSLRTEAPDFWLSYSPGLNSGLIFVPFCSSIFTHYHLASSALLWSSNSTLHLQPIIKNTCSNVWWEKKERRSLLDYLQFSFQSLHQLCAFFFCNKFISGTFQPHHMVNGSSVPSPVLLMLLSCCLCSGPQISTVCIDFSFFFLRSSAKFIY